MNNQEKIVSFLQSIIGLVPKSFHEMSGSQISRTLFSVKPQNWFKEFLKSPFFANFHNLLFTNAKFWHFLDWQKFLIKQ